MKVKLNEKQENVRKRKRITKKTGIICIISAAAAICISFIGYKTYRHEQEGGYKSPYELADDFVTYTYQGDTEAVFKMQPRTFQTRSIEDVQMTYGLDADDTAGAVSKLKEPLIEYIELLNSQHGQWTETHETAEDMRLYSKEELKDLKQTLKFQGVDEDYLYKITKAGIVDVYVDLKASTLSGGYCHTVHVPVYKHNGYWYLGQRTGDVFLALTEGEYEPYGNLLDGFNVVGEWDAEGNRVIRNEEGYQIFTDEDTGLEYYEDIYGNKYYYDKNGHENGKVTRVTGPDGGEPLTEETWEDYWNAYYEEQVPDGSKPLTE